MKTIALSLFSLLALLLTTSCVNSKGDSLFQSDITLRLLSDFLAAPAPPYFDARPAGEKKVQLVWDAAADNFPASTVRYQICQSDTSGGCDSFSPTYTSDAGATVYTTPILTQDQTYYFRIRAFDSGDNVGAVSGEDSAVARATGLQSTAITVGAATFYTSLVPAKTIYRGIDDNGDIDGSAGADVQATAIVDQSFFIGETEVTAALWSAVNTWAEDGTQDHDGDGLTNSADGDDDLYSIINGGSGSGTQPINSVSWRSAMVWANALTEYYNQTYGTSLGCVYTSDTAYATCIRTSTFSGVDTTVGAQDNPYVNPHSKGFRLPTANEWELAARFIEDTNQDGDILDSGEYYPGNFASGADAIYNVAASADYDGDTDTESSSDVAVYSASLANVKSKSANILGLSDMSGNVFEWSFSWYPGKEDAERTTHGGSYVTGDTAVRIGTLFSAVPTSNSSALGFRIARYPD